MNRRMFLTLSAGVAAGTIGRIGGLRSVRGGAEQMPFKISLAEWSLNKTLRAGKMTNLDFPRVAREKFDIDCVEFVDQFFADKVDDTSYLKELKQRGEDNGVRPGLIMLDTNGPLGASRKSVRQRAVDRTKAWIDAAGLIGCRGVRINARGSDDRDELRAGKVETCSELARYAAGGDMFVAIENHGGASSDPDWLCSVIEAVDAPNFGALPDFGNFPPAVNRYDAVEALMPHAKAVSAKAMTFNEEGTVQDTDFLRMMRIVRDGGYSGYVGVESIGKSQADEATAIINTRDQLRRIREQQRRCKPIFNGENLEGWVVVEGGDWSVEDGVLIGRNGRNWSTNPEKTGSWLRTERQYDDFRLELQYIISERGNSGIFFRSAAEKNPAFTGYEMQIFDAPGMPPSKHGPSGIYDVVAPSENRVRPAGEWNTVTIVARGPLVIVEMNGKRVVATELDRSMRGYIGLQNHDEKSVVRFRNIRLEDL